MAHLPRSSTSARRVADHDGHGLELDTSVVEYYGDHEEDWWRSTMSCPNSPSRDETENALK